MHGQKLTRWRKTDSTPTFPNISRKYFHLILFSARVFSNSYNPNNNNNNLINNRRIISYVNALQKEVHNFFLLDSIAFKTVNAAPERWQEHCF